MSFTSSLGSAPESTSERDDFLLGGVQPAYGYLDSDNDDDDYSRFVLEQYAKSRKAEKNGATGNDQVTLLEALKTEQTDIDPDLQR